MNNKYLTGKCLVSMPNIKDSRFYNSVIYICEHTKDGALGLVVNHSLEDFYFSDLIKQLNLSNSLLTDEHIVLHEGGPIEKARGFILHSSEYCQESTLRVTEEIGISSSINTINDIVLGTGPRYNLIALGYSAWTPQQLEKEIIDNTWLIVEPSKELLFKTKNQDKWQKAIDSLGFDLTNISPTIGNC